MLLILSPKQQPYQGPEHLEGHGDKEHLSPRGGSVHRDPRLILHKPPEDPCHSEQDDTQNHQNKDRPYHRFFLTTILIETPKKPKVTRI